MTSAQEPVAPTPESHTTTAGARRGWIRDGLLLQRLAWSVLSLAVVVLFCAGIPPRINELANLDAATRTGLQQLGWLPELYIAYTTLLNLAFFLGFAAVALLIAFRKSNDRLALFVSVNLILFGATFPPVVDALARQPGWRLPVELLIGLTLGFNLVLLFVFPSGHFVPKWTRGLASVWVLWNIFWPFVPAADPFSWPTEQYLALHGGAYGIGLYAQVYGYRRVSNRVQRQQTKWLVYGLIAAFIGIFGIRLLPVIFPRLSTPGVSAVEYGLARTLILTVSGLLIPFSWAIAILRYRIWDIDLIINRTLVYVPLTAILAGLYAASITLSQNLFLALTGQQSGAAAVLPTLVIVAAFTPIKDRLQALVDRRFKEPPGSIRRLEVFCEHVRARVTTVEPHQIARRLLEEAVMAFGAKNGAVYLETAGDLKLVDTMGDWGGEPKLSVPMQAEEDEKQLGLVELGARTNGLGYTHYERETLQDVASVVAQAIERDAKKLFEE